MSTCKRGCCWTPYSCARKEACPCHPDSPANQTARKQALDVGLAHVRLLNYLKGK